MHFMPRTQLPLDDQQLLAGLGCRDNAAVAALYAQYYPAVERLVVCNSGSTAHAQDVFQETVLILLDKAATTDLRLTSSLKTYVLAISGRLWLKRLRDLRRVVGPEPAALECHLPAAEPQVFAAEAEAAPHHRVQGLLARISAKCQALIRALFFRGQSIQEFTEERGYTSVHNAQNQKYKCLEQARRVVRPGGE